MKETTDTLKTVWLNLTAYQPRYLMNLLRLESVFGIFDNLPEQFIKAQRLFVQNNLDAF